MQRSPASGTVAAASVQSRGNNSRVPGWVKYGPQQQAADSGASQPGQGFLPNGLNIRQASYNVENNRQVTAAAVAATAQTITQLSSVEGVEHVEENSYITLLNRPVKAASEGKPRTLSQAAASPATYAYTPVTCPATVTSFPDLFLGKETEGTPYGIHMVEADDESIIQISKEHKSKVGTAAA